MAVKCTHEEGEEWKSHPVLSLWDFLLSPHHSFIMGQFKDMAIQRKRKLEQNVLDLQILVEQYKEELEAMDGGEEDMATEWEIEFVLAVGSWADSHRLRVIGTLDFVDEFVDDYARENGIVCMSSLRAINREVTVVLGKRGGDDEPDTDDDDVDEGATLH
jgi:hypothetical protein